MVDFVSLHNQTDYSILDSLSSTKDLFKRAKELNQKALAITDHGSLAAAWEALKVSEEVGVKLIIGCELYFQDNLLEKNEERLRHLVLLAKNHKGYINLLTLNKKGFDNNLALGKKVYSVIDWNLLKEYSEGLICLTGCGNGIINQLLMNGKFEETENTLLKLKDIFNDNLGIEIQPNNMKRNSIYFNDKIDQMYLNFKNIEFGKKFDIRVVPACNSHYVRKEDHEIHDALLCIGSHQTIYSNFRLKYSVPDFYLKSGDEVKSFFSRNYGNAFAEQLCLNSIYFADLCEDPKWIDPKFSNSSGKELPIFPVKDEKDYNEFLQWLNNQEDKTKLLEEDKQYLRFLCEKNFSLRIKNIEESKIQEYKLRIQEELDVLEYHGFCSYMLIVADYINWAKANDISVGPGRGSVGGSLVAYLLSIHEADPIKYGLIFARFHNKEKTSFPDIDADFATSGRDKVKEYLKKKYGTDHVAHVSNVNTITPKVYVRDISRICELGGSRESAIEIGNNVADCIPSTIHSIDEALSKIPLFSEYCKRYPEFIKYKSICGKYRAWSTHAGGIIISKRPLVGLVPIRKDKDGSFAVEYDKFKAEDNGLVKMDLLGLTTLDIISKTNELIKQNNKNVEVLNLDEYDHKTYDLISSGDTFGVFQFGTSSGTVDLCKRVKPKNISDLSNINALARPSSKDIRNDFIDARNGKKQVALLHPALQRAFGGTYGFGLYEECLMYLAKDIANWSLHKADNLRKLTKEKGKNPEKAKKLREEFIKDSVNNNINEEIAKRIWDEVVSVFAGYGFNISHSTLYSMISYHTAYLKAHFPIEFLLANLMSEVNSNSKDADLKIDKIKNELRANKIKILPPNINKSQLTYTIVDNKLITGLDALKYVGEECIKDIIEKRPFNSFFDFMVRVDSSKVRANNIQALVASGSLDDFNIPRKLMFLYCSDYRKKLQVWCKKHDPTKEQFIYPWVNESDWNVQELYALEQYYLGESFICKPYKAYGSFFEKVHYKIKDIKKAKDKTTIPLMIAIVKEFFEFKVKKEGSKYYGQSMVKATIEDMNGDQCSCTIFPDRWEKLQDRLKQINKKAIFDVGLALKFSGNTNNYEDDIGIILDNVYDISMIPSVPSDLKAKKVNLKKPKESSKNESLDSLLEEIEENLINEGLLDLDVEYDGQ